MNNPIFDVDTIADMYGYYEYEKGYYNSENRKRKMVATDWVDWGEISDEQKRQIGYKRAALHNKGLSRKMTYEENLIYLNELVKFCNRKCIKLLFVVTPTTKYYRDYLDKEYKNKFYETLNNIETTIHLLDLFDSDMFNTEDFIDADHLSDQGADKLTVIINETLTDI